MSFKPFDFTFTPPLTVPTPVQTTTSIGPDTGLIGATTNNQSRASKLIVQLDELTTMSKYLQNVITSRSKTTAVEIDPAVDPDTMMALARIYSSKTPPTFVTVPMYSQLLDAQLGALQLEMEVGNNSPIQANPMQVGDLMTVIKAINTHLIQSATYKTWLPLQLASLKSDAVVFQSWKSSLQTYPIYYAPQSLIPTSVRLGTIQAASTDIDLQLYQYENSVLNHFGQSYSAVYQALAGVHAVERDINSVMIEYFYQPLQNIIRFISLFNALKGFSHKVTMEDLQGDLINYAFARLASDVTSMLHTCDQLVSLATAPLTGALGSLGRIVAGAQAQAAEIGFLTGGGLSGLSKANACAQGNPYNQIKGGKPLVIPGLGQVSDGLKYLAEKLNWAQAESGKGLALVDKSFRQLLERRMKQQDDTNELMCSIRALDALIGMANGVANEFQKGTVTQNSSPQQKQEAAARILTSLQTGSDTTFVADNGQIIVNPPDMPPAPEDVQNVLSRAKIHTTLGAIETF